MSRRFAIIYVWLVVLPLASADPERKSPEKCASLLPTTVGDTLVFEETHSTVDGPTTRTITRTVQLAERKKDGSLTVAIRGESKASGPSVELYQQTDTGLFLLMRDLRTFDPPYCVARLPLKVGDAWEVNDAASFPSPIKYTTGEEEEIKVPAGAFKAVRIEKTMVLRDGKMIRITEWASPGMGLVKVRASLGDGTEVVQVLKSFTPGKK